MWNILARLEPRMSLTLCANSADFVFWESLDYFSYWWVRIYQLLYCSKGIMEYFWKKSENLEAVRQWLAKSYSIRNWSKGRKDFTKEFQKIPLDAALKNLSSNNRCFFLIIFWKIHCSRCLFHNLESYTRLVPTYLLAYASETPPSLESERVNKSVCVCVSKNAPGDTISAKNRSSIMQWRRNTTLTEPVAKSYRSTHLMKFKREQHRIGLFNCTRLSAKGHRSM